MNSRAFLLMAGLGALVLGSAFDAAADVSVGNAAVVTAAQRISLPCTNDGSHQDVAKNPAIHNNLRVTVPKGTVIQWKSSDGDHGAVTLESDLLPGKQVQALGQPGQNYTCTADFPPGHPDLTIKSGQWGPSNTVTVQVQNLNPFAAAAASVTRVEVKSCSSFTVVAKQDSAEVPIGKGETKTLTFTMPPNTGSVFLRVTADATSKVLEKSEANNVSDAAGTCVH